MNGLDGLDLEDVSSDNFDKLLKTDFPENRHFNKGEVVSAMFMDIREMDKYYLIKASLLQPAEYEGEEYAIFMNKPVKKAEGDDEKTLKVKEINLKQMVQFLVAFYTKEQILNRQIDFSALIGRVFIAIAGKVREGKQGGKYQSLNSWKEVKADVQPAASDGLPF